MSVVSSQGARGRQQSQIREKDEKIRLMHDMCERQWTELEKMWQQFEKKVTWYLGEMEKHGQLACPAVKYQTKRDEFSYIEDKFQIPQIKKGPMHDYHQIDIEFKNEKLRDLYEKITKKEEEIESLQKEVDDLNNIIKTSDKIEQPINVIKKEYKETKEMHGESKHQDNLEFLLENMVKFDDLGMKTKQLLEAVEQLQDTLHKWQNKSKLLEEKTKECDDYVTAWNETVCDTEKHINTLKTQFEVEEEMKEHYKRMAQFESKDTFQNQKGSWTLWIEKTEKRIKEQYNRVCSFKDKLEKMKSPYWKNSNSSDSHIATCLEYIENESRGIEDLGKRINENQKYFKAICQLQIREMDENLKTWNTKTKNIYKDIQRMEGNPRLFADEGKTTEYKNKLIDLSDHIQICNGLAQILQKEADEWSERRSKLEKKLRQTNEDIKNLEKQASKIEHRVRVMNRLLEADEKMKRLSEAMDYFKSKQSRLLDKIMDHNKIISRIKGSIEEFGKINYEFWEHCYRNILNFGLHIRSELTAIDSANLNIDLRRKCFLRQRDQQIKESGAVEKELEKSNTILEQKYEKIKQKLDHRITSECLLDNIKDFCREVDRCDEDLQEKLSVWEKKNNDSKRKMISYENEVWKQEEMISRVELSIRRLKSLLEVKNEMEEYRKQIDEMRKNERDECRRWSDHDREMEQDKRNIESIRDMISKNQGELVTILKTNSKYGNDLEDGHKRKIEETIGTIEQMKERSKELYENMESLRSKIADLDSVIEKKFKEIMETQQNSPIAYGQFFEARLERCERFISTIKKCEEKIQLRAKTVENWQSSMKETHDRAKAFKGNPCNIQLDGFRRMLNDCMSKVHQQQAERDKCETMWKNHQVRRKKFTDETEEMMKWLKEIPKSADLSSQIFQSRKETEVKSSQEEILRKNTNVEHLYAGLCHLAGEISILRIRMESVESMINEPGVFEVDSPWRTWGKDYPEKIADVFEKIDGWNENYEALKKKFSKYYKESSYLKKSIND